MAALPFGLPLFARRTAVRRSKDFKLLEADQEVYQEAADVKAVPIYTRFIELGKAEGAIDPRIPTDAILAYIFQVMPLLQHKDYLKTSTEYKWGLFKLFLYGILGKER